VRLRAPSCALFLCLATAGRAELPGAEVRPDSISSDVRSRRPWVIGAEAGWNALPGAGLVVARRLDARLTLEAGVGFSAEGPKFGMRGRYGFLVSEWTPFLGAGFLYGTGVRGPQAEGAPGSVFTYRIDASPFLQLVAGVELQSARGLCFGIAVGYAQLLQENLTVLSGAPLGADLSDLRRRTGSGPVASVSLGRAF
jgi:hypothetical protein